MAYDSETGDGKHSQSWLAAVAYRSRLNPAYGDIRLLLKLFSPLCSKLDKRIQ